MCLSWSMHGSLSCRGRVAYGMSLSKPTLPLSRANRVQQCLNKLKVRTSWCWRGGQQGLLGGGGLLNHSLHSVSEGLRTAPWRLGSEACFKSWAVFDRGDLFSVGLYMVAPCLAEGPCAMWQISAKKKKESKRYREGFWGQRSLEASVIRIIAMFLVLVSASLLWLCGLTFRLKLCRNHLSTWKTYCASIYSILVSEFFICHFLCLKRTF